MASIFWALARPPTFPITRVCFPRGHREPEKFYYDWPHDVLVKKGALTCKRRHRSDPEIFDFEVVFIGNGTARGAVECTVHADNLTQARPRDSQGGPDH